MKKHAKLINNLGTQPEGCGKMSDYVYLEKYATCASCRVHVGWKDEAYPVCDSCKSQAKKESWLAESFIFDETTFANFPNGDRKNV